MRAGEVVGGDDVEHPEGFYFGEEEEEEASEEVERLAVTNSGGVEGEGLEDTAEGGEKRRFGWGT